MGIIFFLMDVESEKRFSILKRKLESLH